jgi:hypothetical protein
LDEETILAVGQLREGANVLVEQDGVLLLVEKQIGFGKVFYLAADPNLQPLSGWDGMNKIYDHLLAFKSPKPPWADAAWDSYQANNALATLPELALPSYVYVCCWLGILLIGPVNYLVLRRINGRNWHGSQFPYWLSCSPVLRIFRVMHIAARAPS